MSPSPTRRPMSDDPYASAPPIGSASLRFPVTAPLVLHEAVVLFLDIDGVLNGCEFSEAAQSNTIRPDCVRRLNRIIDETDCDIVLTSSWRYMVLNGAMTLRGFSYMLRTHGANMVRKHDKERQERLVGLLDADSQCEDPAERSRLITAWVAQHPGIKRHAVVDDMDIQYVGGPFVRTNRTHGLSNSDATDLIKHLSDRRS